MEGKTLWPPTVSSPDLGTVMGGGSEREMLLRTRNDGKVDGQGRSDGGGFKWPDA